MKPIHFKESTATQPTAKIEGKQQMLIHYRELDDGTKISLWSCSIWQRIKFLFHGHIWIGILTEKLPPMWLECDRNIVIIDEYKRDIIIEAKNGRTSTDVDTRIHIN